MKQKSSLTVTPVENGYIVTDVFAPSPKLVFTDAASLAAFVAQFYAENHPQSIFADSPMPFIDPEHNPDNLTPKQVGVADGWRLLRKSEIKDNRTTTPAHWWRNGGWSHESTGWTAPDSTFRTRIPYGQLDAEGASK